VKARRLVGERLISVWSTDQAPDPETEPLSWRGVCQDTDAALGRLVDLAHGDPYLKQMVDQGQLEVEVIPEVMS
jgi:hypothetical protein